MRRKLKEVTVTSEKYNQELLTQFQVRASRRVYCHWILIRRLSNLAYSWHVVNRDGVDYFNYEGQDYLLTYADDCNKDTISLCQSIGVSMRVFTDIEGTINYIAVVTQWKEGIN